MRFQYPVLASEFLRALRGSRSQRAFSRRLGYRTNVAYAWESGRSYPTAAETLRAAERVGIAPTQALLRFYKSKPAWLDSVDPTSPTAVAHLLDDLRGRTSLVELARLAERSRFSIARWLTGRAEPRLPDFLRLIECASLRLLDWLAAFVDPGLLASVKKPWAELEATRRSAYDFPWTVAVLRALELSDYRALPRHRRGWIAERIGITLDEEQQSLRLLSDSGQIHLVSGRWAVRQILAVDTRRDAEAEFALKRFFNSVAIGRLEQGGPGMFSYNVFSVSEADLGRIMDLYRGYFRQLRSIVAQSEPSERVAMVSLQLLPLDRTT